MSGVVLVPQMLTATRLLIIGIAAMCVGRTSQAQTVSVAPQEPMAPVFELASVRQNHADLRRGGPITLGMQPGGRFEAKNVSLWLLLKYVYQVGDTQIIGGPSWLKTDRFDILAKMTEPYDVSRTTAALRNLLSERFGLVVHFETRQQATYRLVRTRPNQDLGKGIRRVSTECEAVITARGLARGQDTPSDLETCSSMMGGGPGRLSIKGNALSILVSRLSAMTGRRVVDGTGLNGLYDIDLTWSDGPDGPSIFAALREQLSLMLDARDERVDVLVIERIAHLVPNP